MSDEPSVSVALRQLADDARVGPLRLADVQRRAAHRQRRRRVLAGAAGVAGLTVLAGLLVVPLRPALPAGLATRLPDVVPAPGPAAGPAPQPDPDGAAVVACRRRAARELGLPDEDGYGVGVARITVSDVPDARVVRGVTREETAEGQRTAFTCVVVPSPTGQVVAEFTTSAVAAGASPSPSPAPDAAGD